MFLKLGELIEINGVENVSSCLPAIDPIILQNFQKTAAGLKQIAPKAEDFLYFSAVMMHAAEASAIHDDGTIKLNASGEQVQVGWDKSSNTLKWQSNDSSVLPYKNSNGDIFPEEELVKAYKKWVGKPLCVDHKSSSVEHVRGFIVDTYYDRKLKRVVALCALDKAGHPQLARQVSTGVSTNVSMGTAVGRAICTDCATVARTEAEFCDHMRRKSGYGEINVDLNPIELSIVVNGADPKASIKNVLAAASTLHAYVNNKEKELEKVSSVNESSLGDFREALKTASSQLNGISESITALSKTAGVDLLPGGLADEGPPNGLDPKQLQMGMKVELEHTNDIKIAREIALDHLTEDPKYYDHLLEMDGTAHTEHGVDELALNTPKTNSTLAPPHGRFASMEQLSELTTNIETKLSQMKTSLDKLANKLTHEDNMSVKTEEMNKEAYFQGTEEPVAPGTRQYPADPTNEAVRQLDNTRVKAENLGPTDGLPPGELEKKKMLARAESEERALKRVAILDAARKTLESRAYPQGTEEPSAPGKPQYPADPLQEKVRNTEDKHMNGKKPFPGVGKVDEMYPGDKDLKPENRASLKAKFIKASSADGSHDLGSSSWDIYLGDSLLLSASVDELSGGRSDLMYNSIASEEFATSLMARVRKEGAEKVTTLIKGAQEMPPVDVEAPLDPELEPAAVGGDEAEVKDLAEKLRDLSSDLVEAVNAMSGEQPGMDEAGALGAMAGDKTLNKVRVGLSSSLTTALKDTIADINEHVGELDMLTGLYDKGSVTASNAEYVSGIVADTITEAKASMTDGFKLVEAFVKYARGTKAMLKKAEMEKDLTEDSQSADDDLAAMLKATEEALAPSDTPFAAPAPKEMDVEVDFGGNSVGGAPSSPLDMGGEMFGDTASADDCATSEDDDKADDKDSDKDCADDNAAVVEVTKPDVASVVPTLSDDDVVRVTAGLDLTTKAGRAAMRAKLAADSVTTKHSLQEAHPGGGFTPQLDPKPEGDLGKFETIDETQKAMMDMANAPVKVRKEAESIRTLIANGSLVVEDLEALVAEGLDSDAVSYYKKYFADADGGKEFAAELVKQHAKAAVDAEVATEKVKLARAYELAYDMAAKGFIGSDRQTVTAQVEAVLEFSPENFDHLKTLIASKPAVAKTVGVMPAVGQFGGGDALTTVASASGNLQDELSNMFSGFKGRNF